MEFKLNFPVETEEARRFWASKHRLNRIKAIIAFSTDLKNANDNLRRAGYASIFRHKMLNLYKCYVNQPKMGLIPFSDLSEPWYEPIPCVSTTVAPVAFIPIKPFESMVTKWTNGKQKVTINNSGDISGNIDRLNPDGTPNGGMGYGSIVSGGDSSIAEFFINGRDVNIYGRGIGSTNFTVTSGDGTAKTIITVEVN